MLIRVNDNWRISTDEVQWILQRRRKAKKDTSAERWDSVGYFGSLALLFDIMTRRRIFAIDGEYPPEALELLANALTEIRLDVQRALSRAQESGGPAFRGRGEDRAPAESAPTGREAA
jgi:hypothetical protein